MGTDCGIRLKSPRISKAEKECPRRQDGVNTGAFILNTKLTLSSPRNFTLGGQMGGNEEKSRPILGGIGGKWDSAGTELGSCADTLGRPSADRVGSLTSVETADTIGQLAVCGTARANDSTADSWHGNF